MDTSYSPNIKINEIIYSYNIEYTNNDYFNNIFVSNYNEKNFSYLNNINDSLCILDNYNTDKNPKIINHKKNNNQKFY